jgi:hypothetical protein
VVNGILLLGTSGLSVGACVMAGPSGRRVSKCASDSCVEVGSELVATGPCTIRFVSSITGGGWANGFRANEDVEVGERLSCEPRCLILLSVSRQKKRSKEEIDRRGSGGQRAGKVILGTEGGTPSSSSSVCNLMRAAAVSYVGLRK